MAADRLLFDFTRQVMHYLVTVQAPFRDIDRRDEQALEAARKKAIALGEPLSRALRSYCTKHGLEAYVRLIDVHRSLRFLADLPDRRPILR